LVILGEKMVERLVLLRTAFFRNGFIPVFGVTEHGVHVKNHPSEGMFTMADNLAQ